MPGNTILIAGWRDPEQMQVNLAMLRNLLAVGPARPLRMAEAAPGWEDTWQRVVARHGLRSGSLAQLVGSSWQFTDRAFGFGVEHPGHTVLSTIKLRQAGFADCIDTEDSVLYWLDRMQAGGLLPR